MAIAIDDCDKFKQLEFIPFNPQTKRTEATLKGPDGVEFKVTNVNRTIFSVNKLIEGGYEAHFTSGCCWLENPKNCHTIGVERSDVLFFIRYRPLRNQADSMRSRTSIVAPVLGEQKEAGQNVLFDQMMQPFDPAEDPIEDEVDRQAQQPSINEEVRVQQTAAELPRPELPDKNIVDKHMLHHGSFEP